LDRLRSIRPDAACGRAIACHGAARQARPQRRALVHGSHRSAGFPVKAAVENVGAGYHLAEAFSGWRDSPPHRANMLKPGVTRMGIAAVYAPNSKYKVFWTLIMASPDDREG
jgi:uncharacterized protein YkwD